MCRLMVFQGAFLCFSFLLGTGTRRQEYDSPAWRTGFLFSMCLCSNCSVFLLFLSAFPLLPKLWPCNRTCYIFAADLVFQEAAMQADVQQMS